MDDPDSARKSAPADTSERARYDRDLYSWAVEQPALLRAGRLGEVDALNLAEEIDDVGNEQYDKLESAFRIILLHLLKWDYQPSGLSRSWWPSIQVQRNGVEKVVRKNPGLRPQIDEATAAGYKDARLQAAVQTGLELKRLPLECPYSFIDITEREIHWPPTD